MAKNLPNKGAVSISFKIADRSFLFINCHLSAHIEHREIRDEQFTIISDHFVHGIDQTAGGLCSSPAAVSIAMPDQVMKWDSVIWMGDFNSRIELKKSPNIELDVEKNKSLARLLIKRGEYEEIAA